MYVVGLTGGIASGKTTVANAFADLGIDLVDADLVARQVVEPGQQGLNAITEAFGTEVLLDNGELNRTTLRELVFTDPVKKEQLNALLHPLIHEEMLAQLKQCRSPYAVLVVPLLVENKLEHMCDRILVVDVDPEVQIQRTMARDGSKREVIEGILAAQVSREQRLAAADDVLDNQGSSDEIKAKVAALHQQYLALSS